MSKFDQRAYEIALRKLHLYVKDQQDALQLATDAGHSKDGPSKSALFFIGQYTGNAARADKQRAVVLAMAAPGYGK